MTDTSGWRGWLSDEAARREASGLQRAIRHRGPDDDVVDLAGNDYLGLSRHPDVVEAAVAAARTWGAGAGASRLVTGSLAIHAELEAELATYTSQPAALVFSTGYHANLSVVSALAGRDALVVSDSHVHASLVDAVRLSRSAVEVVPHNDVEAVAGAVARAEGRRVLVLVESVYSVLGDQAPLVELASMCSETGALIVVDEAHALGVHGPGLVSRFGIAGHEHVVVTATLSKALGSQGGVVLGSRQVVEHLVNRARPFIYDTGLAPSSAGAALAALRLLRDRPDLPDVVGRRVHDLAAALGVEPPAGAVLSVPMPSPQVAVAAQAAALEQGVRVGCFRPPSVPDGVSRLRVTTSAGISPEDWERAVEVLVAVVKEHAG
jgi:8-amino-7-oxononanoate synthase